MIFIFPPALSRGSLSHTIASGFFFFFGYGHVYFLDNNILKRKKSNIHALLIYISLVAKNIGHFFYVSFDICTEICGGFLFVCFFLESSLLPGY